MTAPAFSNTPYRIIKDAMEDAGLLQEGDEPKSEHYAKYMLRLHKLISYIQTQGIKLWLQTDVTVTLAAGFATYTMTAGAFTTNRVMRIVQSYYSDSSGVRRELTSLSRDEYSRLSNITDQSAINSYFVDKQKDGVRVSFWPVPDITAATGTAHVIVQNQVTLPISLTEDMDFPTEWALYLEWGLADLICTGQPQAIMDRCAARALAYRIALEDWDVEDASTRFEPDARSGNERGRFV